MPSLLQKLLEKVNFDVPYEKPSWYVFFIVIFRAIVIFSEVFVFVFLSLMYDLI